MLGLKFYSKTEVVRAIVVNIYQYIFYIYRQWAADREKSSSHNQKNFTKAFQPPLAHCFGF